jgi:putative ATP-dependent clp protease ATP-binding subunit clpA
LVLSPEAETHLLNLGYTPEYGAREIERIVARELKPLLTRSLLFGDLKHGGEAKVDVVAKKLVLSTTPLVLPAEAAESAPKNEALPASTEEGSNKKKPTRSTTGKTTKKTTKKSDE